MNANPEVVAPQPDKVRAVAKYQRWVILALLLNIAIIILSLVMVIGRYELPASFVLILRVILIAVAVFQVTSVVLLAKQFSHIVLAILAGIVTFLPYISLLVLLIYNQKATKYLREHGVHVGFFGAKPNAV
jgi:hypothetical protein